MQNKYAIWFGIQSCLPLHFMSFWCLSKGEPKPRQFSGQRPAQRFHGVNIRYGIKEYSQSFSSILIGRKMYARLALQCLLKVIGSGLYWILMNSNCKKKKKKIRESWRIRLKRHGRAEPSRRDQQRPRQKKTHLSCSPFSLFPRVRWSWKLLGVGLSLGRMELLCEQPRGSRVFTRN